MIALLAAAAAVCGVAFLRASGERGAFGVAAGVAVGLGVSGAVWSAGLLLFGLTGFTADLVVIALAGAFTLSERRSVRTAPVSGLRDAPLALVIACGLAALVVSALFVEHSVRYPEGGWDAVAIWNLRARSLYGAPDRLADVFAPDLAAQHPDYPLLLPGLIAHAWFALGSRTALVPIAVSFFFAAAGAVALGTAVSARKGPTAGLAATLLLLGTPQFLALAWNQYADLKLAVLVLVAVVLVTGRRFAAAGLVAGLGAYTKNEGLVWLGLLLLVVLLWEGWGAGLRLLMGAALPLALLGWFKLRWAPQNDLVAQTSVDAMVARLPQRVLPVARGFVGRLVDFPTWGAALPALVVAWIARGYKRERALASRFAAFSLAAIFCIYLATPQNVVAHMQSSLDRLLFQVWPAIIYATALALAPAEAPAAAAPRTPAKGPA